MEWKLKKLDGFIQINKNNISKDYDFLAINYYDISSIGTGIKGKAKYYKIEDIPSRAKRIIKDDDIIIATVRPINRSFYYCTNTQPNDIVSTGFAVLSAKKHKMDSRFLYYIISSKNFTSYLVSQEQGATYPAITSDVIKKAKINLPPLKTQQKIASLLSNYDKLIENNTQRIKLLESMAEELYKEWFVRLRFPDHERVEVVDGLPVGWEIMLANTIADITIGKTPPRKEFEHFKTVKNDDNLRWISIKDIGNSNIYNLDSSEYLLKSSIEKFNMKIIPKDTILLSFKLTVGKVIITTENSTTNEAIAHFTNLNKKIISTEYLYCYFKNFQFSTLGNTSSIATAVNSKIIKSMKIIVPKEKTLNQFTEYTKPIFEEIKLLILKNQTLKQTRDLLLPRLMSGKLNVEDLDII